MRTVIDLGSEVRDLCLEQTGTAPVRPHMITFNGGDYNTGPSGNTHALVSFVATGHVVFFDAATRAPVKCIDVGTQAHAIWPTPDQKHAIVADQNGRKLHRIATDYAKNEYQVETSFDLANCTTPAGGACTTPLRNDNAPICPRVDAANRYTFVTLRGVECSCSTTTPPRCASWPSTTAPSSGPAAALLKSATRCTSTAARSPAA
ncbi:YncE family protein [Deinococcus malanensis]|uniref:YncE family protein n=1 Tax=Deinococcus malanensis TaxID=1706855 RepID=UPI00362BAB7A